MSAGALEKMVEKAVIKATGQQWCSYGRHYVRTELIVQTKPRVKCQRCVDDVRLKRGTMR